MHRVKITLVRAVEPLVRTQSRFFGNFTVILVGQFTHHVDLTLMRVLISFVRVAISLIGAKTTLLRVNITLVRVQITFCV
jgi:hypothetical protein